MTPDLTTATGKPATTKALAHANKGRSLELAILASAGNLIVLDRHGQEAKRLPGGKMVAKRGPVDFSGTIRGTGRSIRFDAKTCAQVRSFPIGNRDHFPEHQRQSLIRHGEAGAIAGLLVESTATEHYFWLDWRHLDTAEKSIRWDDSRWVVLGPSSKAVPFRSVPGVMGAFNFGVPQ